MMGYEDYRQFSNIRCTLAGYKIVDHSDVAGASPVGAAPTTSSFSTIHLVSFDWAQTTAWRDEKQLSLGIWCTLYQRFYGILLKWLSHCPGGRRPQRERKSSIVNIMFVDDLAIPGARSSEGMMFAWFAHMKPNQNGCHFADNIFLNAFHWNQIFVLFKFHWDLFPMVQCTTNQHCFR